MGAADPPAPQPPHTHRGVGQHPGVPFGGSPGRATPSVGGGTGEGGIWGVLWLCGMGGGLSGGGEGGSMGGGWVWGGWDGDEYRDGDGNRDGGGDGVVLG